MESWMQSRKRPPKEQGSFIKSFGTLRYIPRFFRLIWHTSPVLTSVNVFFRLLQAGIPVLLLYVGKLIIDSVVTHISTGDKDLTGLWTLVGLELGLGLLSDIFSRVITL